MPKIQIRRNMINLSTSFFVIFRILFNYLIFFSPISGTNNNITEAIQALWIRNTPRAKITISCLQNYVS